MRIAADVGRGNGLRVVCVTMLDSVLICNIKTRSSLFRGIPSCFKSQPRQRVGCSGLCRRVSPRSNGVEQPATRLAR